MSQKQPRAVKAAAELAEQRFNEVYAASEDQRDDQNEQAPPQEPETPPQQTPEQPPEQQPEQAPAPQEPPKSEDWEKKYNVLNGKYRAEVPRLHEENRRLRNELQGKDQRIQQLENTLASINTPEEGENPLVSEEERGEYGEDLVKLVERVAEDKARRMVATVRPEIENVRGQLQQTTEQTRAQNFYAQLDDTVENWRDINKDPAFLEWLTGEVPFTGRTRQDVLGESYQQGLADGNASRVVAFFRGYLDEQKVVAPPRQQPRTQQQPAPQTRQQPQVSLEQLAGPGVTNGGAAAPAEPRGPEPWTRKQIAAFYKDVQLGKFRENPALKAEIEQKIHAAQAAGLIRV